MANATTTEPICCETCRHMATRAKCDDCGHGPEDDILHDPFRYLNHEPGNWRMDLARQHISGEESLVIGWQGEAEVNVNDTPDEAYKELCRVSEQCGYMTSRPARRGKMITIDIYTTEGLFRLKWTDGKLSHIVRMNPHENTEHSVSWSLADDILLSTP